MSKIAVVGAHGTGKTTLLRAIQECSLRGVVVDEIPRLICQAAGDPTFLRRDNNTFDKQVLIIGRQVAEEAKAESSSHRVWTDRCVVDHWSYTETLFPGESRSALGRQWKNLVFDWMSTYAGVVILKCEVPPIDDGVREADIQFQLQIDESIRTNLAEAGVEPFELSGSTPERLEILSKFISDHEELFQ